VSKIPSLAKGAFFRRTFALGGGWLHTDFAGGYVWTLRTEPATDADLTDTGPTVVFQTRSLSPGGALPWQFPSPTEGIIAIPTPITRLWPSERDLYFDLWGIRSESDARRIDAGRLFVGAVVTANPLGL